MPLILPRLLHPCSSAPFPPDTLSAPGLLPTPRPRSAVPRRQTIRLCTSKTMPGRRFIATTTSRRVGTMSLEDYIGSPRARIIPICVSHPGNRNFKPNLETLSLSFILSPSCRLRRIEEAQIYTRTVVFASSDSVFFCLFFHHDSDIFRL